MFIYSLEKIVKISLWNQYLASIVGLNILNSRESNFDICLISAEIKDWNNFLIIPFRIEWGWKLSRLSSEIEPDYILRPNIQFSVYLPSRIFIKLCTVYAKISIFNVNIDCVTRKTIFIKKFQHALNEILHNIYCHLKKLGHPLSIGHIMKIY